MIRLGYGGKPKYYEALIGSRVKWDIGRGDAIRQSGF